MEILSVRGISFASSLGFRPLLATKNLLESTRFVRGSDPIRWKFKFSDKQLLQRNLSYNYVLFLNRINAHEVPLFKFNKNIIVKRYCQSKTSADANKDSTTAQQPKVSIFAKMKQLGKDYWHVLLPIHVITSTGWMIAFYLIIKNGVDIVQLLEYMNFSDKYLDMARNSSASNWALAYFLFKIVTPLRYTVTVGVTTMAIKQLSKTGLIKPFGKQAQGIFKTTKSSKTPHKRLKVEQQTEPPKT